jgi:hypothetical protein
MNTAASTNTLRDAWIFPIRVLLLSALIALVFVSLALAAGLSKRQTEQVSSETRLAQCNQLAGIAIEKLAADGIDVRTKAWHRQRYVAAQACMNDFANFDWLTTGR